MAKFYIYLLAVLMIHPSTGQVRLDRPPCGPLQPCGERGICCLKIDYTHPTCEWNNLDDIPAHWCLGDLEGRCLDDIQCNGGDICVGKGPDALGHCMDDPAIGTCDKSVDVAIVGAGPGGAYAAYKLRHQGQTIGLFEYSDHVGGRCLHSVLDNAPDVNLEMGAMRFMSDVMPKLEGLIRELNLTSSVFTEGFGHTDRTRYFLRGQNIPASQLKAGEVPYNLTAEEKAHQSDLVGYYIEKLTGSTKGEFSRYNLRMLRLLNDGRLLGELSYEEFLDMAASPEAKAMLNDAKKFQGETYEPTNVLFVLHDDYGSDFFGGDVMKIDDVGGMQAVPIKMVESFQRENPENNKLFKNHKLVGIRHRETDKRSVLYFQRTFTLDGVTRDVTSALTTVCARQVILALPQFALMQVDWPPIQTEWADYVYSGVHGIPASKIYLTFDRAWWLDSNFTNFPSPVTFGGGPTTHQMYDWKRSNTTGDYILLVYSDGDTVEFQKYLQEQGPTMDPTMGSSTGPAMGPAMGQAMGPTMGPSMGLAMGPAMGPAMSPAMGPAVGPAMIPAKGPAMGPAMGPTMLGSPSTGQRVSGPLKDAMLDDFARVFNVSRSAMPEPKSGVAQIWAGYPLGGGWVMQRPGYDIDDLVGAMQRPSITQEVYVAGSDFSWGANIGWSEGAFETVQAVLDRYFTV